MTTASIAVEEALLLLKLGFLVLLYLFLWRVVRSASRDLRTPQESFVLAPQQQRARQPEPAARRTHGRLVPLDRAAGLRPHYDIDSAAITVGRGAANDVALEDDYASTQHARIETRQDGVWVEDVGSTNGTLVNGEAIGEPRRLAPGDVVRIGGTELRYER